MKKLYAILFLVALIHTGVYGQAKKPTIMVVPANVWCTHNGYTQKYNNQGTITEIPDYKKALDNDFPLKDMASSIRSIEQSSAEHEMTTSSTSGASLAESPLDRLMNRAKADILIEVVWNINTMGPKRSVTYTLRGLDAYTNKQVAATQGTGEPSMAAEVAVLLEEAVVDKMDAFVSQLQKHFDDLMANGREVALEVRVFDNGSGVNLESEFGGAELQEIIEDWVAQNTVAHRFSLTDATENMMLFEQVRIPLYRENGMARDTRSFANDLRKYLNQKANLTCKVMTKGLGKAELVIGEK
ncbi:DUF6175 family protein [uncultured Phocaeicola sp.]|uniref:DUF6175 family protein n=1 Tax=uncultured Phocaeicola sp. TaxID=990718 RepID=UPI0025969F51|nr:DUF6175 family protein [uncultured Phocaeicola sp.]